MSDNNKYKTGKIYTIRNKNDDTQVYVGSTIQSLGCRMSKHKHDGNTERCKGWSLYRIIDNNWDDWELTLFALYPCNSKAELCRREGEVIREIGTLNQRIAGRTIKERYVEDKAKIAGKMKEYYIRKQDEIKKQKKDYYIRNRDTIREKSRLKYVSRKRG
jgi:hypothetical protein